MSGIDRERAQRRRSMHERQTVVFGVILAVMAVSGLIGAAVFTGTTSLPFFSRGFSTESPSTTAVTVPCLPDGTLPVSFDQVTVNVYNGAGRTGLAGLTGAALTARGFTLGKTGNFTSTLADTGRIVFGPGSVPQAYTLAAEVGDVVLSFDAARTDPSVDLVLGTSFTDLVAVDKVGLDPHTPLANPAGCVALQSLLTGAPATAG